MEKNSEIKTTGDDAVRLKKEITLMNGVGIIVGCILGSGVFISPTGVLRQVNSVGASLVVWVACGIFSMLGALCYAELGCMINRSGADYAYVMTAFGPFAAFLKLWVDVIVSRPCSLAILAMTFAKYVLEPFFVGCEQPQIAVKLLAALCILIFTFINCYSVKYSTMVQDVFSYAITGAFILIIITGFVQIGRGRVENFENAFEDSNLNLGAIATAVYSGLYAFSGWNSLNSVIEEMRNPKKDLPLAIIISVILSIIIYVLVNVSLFTTVTPEEMIRSLAVATTFGDRIYGTMSWIIPVFVTCATFGSFNSEVLVSSRLFFVAAQEKQMPSILEMVQLKLFTPMPAVLFTCVTSLVYLIFDDLYVLVNYMGFIYWLSIGISVYILVHLRFTKPDWSRPIKIPLVIPITYILLTTFLLIFSFIGAPMESIMACIIIISGIPVYLIFIKWERKPQSFQRLLDSFTCYTQKVLLVVQEEKSFD